MARSDAVLSYIVDGLTNEIEEAEAAGDRYRSRALRKAREQVLAVALGTPRRWWEVWKR